jgi:hypothetical protein
MATASAKVRGGSGGGLGMVNGWLLNWPMMVSMMVCTGMQLNCVQRYYCGKIRFWYNK